MYKTVLLAAAGLITIHLQIPPQFQNNRTVVLHTMTPEEVTKKCGDPGKAANGEKLYVVACGDINGKHVYMPNPCKYPEVKDENSYAHLLCHEIAHTEGWAHKEKD